LLVKEWEVPYNNREKDNLLDEVPFSVTFQAHGMVAVG